MNRLSRETSPYLLQHADNPVDWFPWGDEALALARAQDRPILLSIGYSACHWCHVMAHESFEDADTARLMNEHFVCVKVDREERPDIDQTYQTAVQVLGGRGGWPLTVFLTPTLEPFFGGTYFPPQPRPGLPSFRQVLQALADAWTTRRDQVDSSAEQLREVLAEIAANERGGKRSPVAREVVTKAADGLLQRYDPDHGGFGTAPKFPNSLLHELWLRTGHVGRVLHTLRQMGRGGIYDQLGGGWHRYSTDERWLVPHFEKMLYDNALLLRLSTLLHQASGDAEVARLARETAGWVLSEMTSEGGGFYSTQDADSEGEEGRFFVWTEAQVAEVVGEKDAPLVCRAFGVVPGGNFEHGASVLHRPVDTAQLVALYGRPADEVERVVADARKKLLDARGKRVRPGLDDKIITSWNGLMIHALALAGAHFGEPGWVQAAERASDFLDRTLKVDGRWKRTWRAGEAKIDAFAEDHAFVAEGELALFEATGHARHFERALEHLRAIDQGFVDPQGGALFLTHEGGEALLHRPRSVWDDAVPSATSSACHAMLRVFGLTGEARWVDLALACLEPMIESARRQPFGFGYLLGAVDAAAGGVGTMVVTGPEGDATREALLREARAAYAPSVVVVPWTGAETLPSALASLLEGKSGSAAAYFCVNGTCSPPVTDPAALARVMQPQPRADSPGPGARV